MEVDTNLSPSKVKPWALLLQAPDTSSLSGDAEEPHHRRLLHSSAFNSSLKSLQDCSS